jgi:ubiquinone/menaquinone biosynthesis C-methylase UbiE
MTDIAGPSLDLDSETLARDYDQISAQRQFISGQRLVKELAIAAGEHVLDVGCGTGLLAEYIANLTGPKGYVLGIDPLPLRIALAVARTREGLAFRVGEAYQLADLPAAGFDVVCLNAVFHWLPEKSGPLREFARLLRVGGRLGIATRLGHRHSSLREAMTRVMARLPFSEHPYRRGVMSEPITEEMMSELLHTAGFAVARLDVRSSVRTFASADEIIRFSEASSFGNLFGNLPAELKAAARAALKQELESIAGGHKLREERLGLIAIGTRQ